MIDNSVFLKIKKVSKTFFDGNSKTPAIKNVTLDVYKGEFVSLIGPSGCGKTTLLRLIAGLDGEYEGDIILEGKRIE